MRQSLFNLYQLLDIFYPIYINGYVYAILKNIKHYYTNILFACKYLNGSVSLQDIKQMTLRDIDKFLETTYLMMQQEIKNKKNK
jgi:hypothetical protein